MRMRGLQFFNINMLKSQDGNAMIVTLMVMAILSIVGVNAITISTNEQKITTNVETQKASFYDADSGVQFALASLENGLIAGTANVLPANVGDTVTFITDPDDPDDPHATPDGFSFEISDIEMIAVTPNFNVYSFTSTGHSQNAYREADTVINVRFRRGNSSAITFAAFADTKLDTKSSGTTLSYDSSSPDPTKNNPGSALFATTHQADVGSNDWLVTHNGASIDGDGIFGEQDDGSATTDGIHDPSDFYGTAPVNVGRIDPDPLGINTANGEYNPTTYSAVNDNAAYATINGNPVVGNTIITNNGNTVTLTGKPGGSNFYFTKVDLKNSVTMNINTTNGPVNIFLDGSGAASGVIFDSKNSTTINITPGTPTDFTIYSNSTQKINFKHNSEFSGFVYAPFGSIDMKNSSSVYGALWGNNIDIKNSGTLYYDEALADKYTIQNNNLSLISWEAE